MKLRPLYLLLTIFILAACSTPKESSEVESVKTEVAADQYVDDLGDVVRGFDSIEALTQSLVKSLVNKNYREYLSHTMTEEMEMSQAELIVDEKIRKRFVSEYGFSLREEKHYFDFTIKYFEEHKVDIAKANLDDLDYIEYKSGAYSPLELYEVFIPVDAGEYPETIDLVIIKIEDKFYLTSELGI